MANAYACSPAIANDTRPQGQCGQGFVEVNPTVVVFSADIPDAGAMTAVFLLGFVANFGGPEVIALVTREVVRLIKQL